MKVAVYYNNNDLRILEHPRPVLQEGEILVKVRASGICGTDVIEWYRIKKAPRILGHEIAGDIAETRTGKYTVGQRVFVSHHVPCNVCNYCRAGNHTACETLHKGNYDPGGYSEFVRVPQANVERGTYVLPGNVSYEEGTMIEPLGCVVRGQRMLDIRKGQTVLILGSGVSGLLNIRVAKLKGAEVIATDIDAYRLAQAKRSGADEVIHAQEQFQGKADRVIICTGAPAAVKQAFECVDRKGIIQFFAIPGKTAEIPLEDFWRNELTVSSTYGAAPVDLEEALELILDGRVPVRDLITHTLPLNDIQKGFKLVTEARNSLKVVILP
ncbi:MAG: alcohol dehydrogenase catalytic domain-containing protein [Candidatus Omnitrophica bacterium]|nr:alcohol dehydrogenase catalytic domain-containing protein [Candidatus Omnitrophota bacterium]